MAATNTTHTTNTTNGPYATYVTHQAEYQVRVSAFDLVTQSYHVSIFYKKTTCLEFQATKLFVGPNNHIVVMCVDNKSKQSLAQQMPRHPSQRPPHSNQRSPGLYVSVDSHIRIFHCLAPIDKLISRTVERPQRLMGDTVRELTVTDAVYASLVDLAGNVYLIHEYVILRKPPILADQDYYQWYHQHMQLSERTVRNGWFGKPTVIPGFMNIAEFFVKNHKCLLKYTGSPAREYDLLMNINVGSDVRETGFPNDMAVRIGSKYHRLAKQKYIRLQQAYGKLMHFQALEIKYSDCGD